MRRRCFLSFLVLLVSVASCVAQWDDDGGGGDDFGDFGDFGGDFGDGDFGDGDGGGGGGEGDGGGDFGGGGGDSGDFGGDFGDSGGDGGDFGGVFGDLGGDGDVGLAALSMESSRTSVTVPGGEDVELGCAAFFEDAQRCAFYRWVDEWVDEWVHGHQIQWMMLTSQLWMW